MDRVKFTVFETPIGRCAVAWVARTIMAVQLPQPEDAQTRVRLRQRHGDPEEAPPPDRIRRATESIVKLLSGQREDLSMIDVDLRDCPDFNRSVYAIARTIPPGATLTYGDIAKRLGGVELSRQVGAALGQNPCPILVPCHRVLAAGDKPGGFSANGGVITKMKLLAIEGAVVNYTPSLFD